MIQKFNGLEIRQIRKTDSVRAYLDFISELIDEGTYLSINKKPTMAEQKKWVNERRDGTRNNTSVFLSVWDGKKHVANCEGKKGRWKESGNVLLGIAILKKYRGKGLGEKLLREIILLSKKKLKPKNIYLNVFAKNKIALSLYRKVGFRELARFPKWYKHKGKYYDSIYS